MTIDYHGDDLPGMFNATPAEVHARLGLAQAARFQADLAIARWSDTADTTTPARAAWMARAHDGLQLWLDAGGFAQHQHEDAAPTSALYDDSALPFPGNRPLLYTLFRHARSTTD
jgi:hypothetical protein